MAYEKLARKFDKVSIEDKYDKKYINEKKALMRKIADAPSVKNMVLTIITSSKRNPKAVLKVTYVSGAIVTYESKRVGGYGYDMISTVSANVLNQCPAVLKLLYDKMEKAPLSAENHKVLGYGSGYGALPYFEGAVGISCHERILEKLGFKEEYNYVKAGTEHITTYAFMKGRK